MRRSREASRESKEKGNKVEVCHLEKTGTYWSFATHQPEDMSKCAAELGQNISFHGDSPHQPASRERQQD